MSYQVKKTIASMVSGVPVLVAYCIHAFLQLSARGAEIANDLSFWASTMLVFIGIGVGFSIIVQIFFHVGVAAGGEIKRRVSAEIAKEIKKKVPDFSAGKPMKEVDCTEIEAEDEMDKLISLKAMRIGYITAGAGFIASLVTLVLKLPPAVMINTLFLSLGLGSLLEGIAQLYYYKRGV